MASTRRIGGPVAVTVDGVTYQPAGPWTISMRSTEREMLMGPGGVAGFKETPIAPFCEGEIFVSPAISLRALEAVVGGTVRLEGPDGTVYVFNRASQVGALDYGTDEGKVQVRFEAEGADEIKP